MAILIFSGLGLGALAFLLRFLAALIRESKSSAHRGRRSAERSLALTLMDQYRRKKRAA
ncbi:MAG: hypothetical protein ACM3NO_02220 [Deltaproteobacteria bacterium]